MNRDSILLLLALLLAIAAAIIDVQQHRIPNRLTYPGIICGFVLRMLFFGFKGWDSGLATAATGFLLGGGIMFFFYMVRAMGAGDVKLMAALGAIVGRRDIVGILLATAIFGGVLGIAYALYRGRIGSTLRNVGSVLRFHAWAGLQAHPELNLDNPSALRMPYGLAIALGTLYMFLAMWWR
jgi:prepilin peptidase CpaA